MQGLILPILKAFHNAPSRGLTVEELAERTGFGQQSIQGAISNMRARKGRWWLVTPVPSDPTRYAITHQGKLERLMREAKHQRKVGRPKKDYDRSQHTIRLRDDVVARLKADHGSGWVDAVNTILANHLHVEPASAIMKELTEHDER